MVNPVALSLGIVSAVDARFAQHIQVSKDGSTADVHLVGKVLSGTATPRLQELNDADQPVSARELHIC